MECREMSSMVNQGQEVSIKLPISCFDLFVESFNECDMYVVALSTVYNNNREHAKNPEKEREFQTKLEEYITIRQNPRQREENILSMMTCMVDIFSNIDILIETVSVCWGMLSGLGIKLSIKFLINYFKEKKKQNLEQSLKDFETKMNEKFEEIKEQIKQRSNSTQEQEKEIKNIDILQKEFEKKLKILKLEHKNLV